MEIPNAIQWLLTGLYLSAALALVLMLVTGLRLAEQRRDEAWVMVTIFACWLVLLSCCHLTLLLIEPYLPLKPLPPIPTLPLERGLL